MNKDPEEPVMNIEVEMGIQQVRRIGSSLNNFFFSSPFQPKVRLEHLVMSKAKAVPRSRRGEVEMLQRRFEGALRCLYKGTFILRISRNRH